MDRINLRGTKYRLTGDSPAWREHRRAAIEAMREHWESNGWYFEPCGQADYYQLYDCWEQRAIYNAECRFILDAGDEVFTICDLGPFSREEGAAGLDEFEKLAARWRDELQDPTIRLEPVVT